MNQTIWIVGKHRSVTPEGSAAWDFQGAFSEESLAEAACQEREDFIAPAVLNEALQQQTETWAGCRYPIIEREA